MVDFLKQLQAQLGVRAQPGAVPAPSASGSGDQYTAPPRPEPVCAYSVTIRRSMVATVVVELPEGAGHADVSEHIDSSDVVSQAAHWESEDEIEVIEYFAKGLANQAELDAWDDAYGPRYDWDGDPICEECCELLFNPQDEIRPDGRHVCQDCYGEDDEESDDA